MGRRPSFARGRIRLSVLRTCVTKQTGDMHYSEAEPLWFTAPVLRTMMRYALESELCRGSTFCSSCRVIRERRCRLQISAISSESRGQQRTDGSTDIKKSAQKVFST